MTLFKREVTIDFTKAQAETSVALWCEVNRLEPDSLDDLSLTVEVEVDPSDFDNEEIFERYDEITAPGEDWIARVYRLMAEGDTASAMDEMHREFPGLAPPSTAMSLFKMLGTGRG